MCTAWSNRLEFQSIAWDMKKAGGWVGGGWNCSESKWEKILGESKPPLILSILAALSMAHNRALGLIAWTAGWQAKSDDNHANFHSETMCFLPSHWLTVEKWAPKYVWGAPVFLLSFLYSQRYFHVHIALYKHAMWAFKHFIKHYILWPLAEAKRSLLSCSHFSFWALCSSFQWKGRENGNGEGENVKQHNTLFQLATQTCSCYIWIFTLLQYE